MYAQHARRAANLGLRMKASYLKAIALHEAALRTGAPSDRCQCCGAHVADGAKGCFEHFSLVLALGYSDPRYGCQDRRSTCAA